MSNNTTASTLAKSFTQMSNQQPITPTTMMSLYSESHPQPTLIVIYERGLLYQHYRQLVEMQHKARGVQRSFEATPDVIQMGKECDAWLKDKTTDTPQMKQGILLMGSVGCGKSTMAQAILDYIFWQLRDRYTGRKVERSQESTPRRFGWSMSAEDYASRTKEERDEFDYAPMVLLDDIGTEPVRLLEYGTEYFPFRTFIENRYNRAGVDPQLTVATTNLSLEQIGATYGTRTADRIRELFEIVHVNGATKRK